MNNKSKQQQLKFQREADIPNIKDPTEQIKSVFLRDIRFKEPYKKLIAKWQPGENWVRIIPSIAGSQFPWLMRLEVCTPPDSQPGSFPQFVHPRTLDPEAISPFDIAFHYLRRNNPSCLYKRENPHGFRLNTKGEAIAWCILGGREKGDSLKLLCASVYNGAWGGTPGLAHKIWDEAHMKDSEEGSPNYGKPLYGDITDPDTGRLVLIHKSQPETGDKYSNYTVRIGKNINPIEKAMQRISEEERQLIVPLERTLYIPSEDEQMDYLKEYLGNKLFYEIFSSHRGGQSKSNEWAETENETHNEASPEEAPSYMVEDLEEDSMGRENSGKPNKSFNPNKIKEHNQPKEEEEEPDCELDQEEPEEEEKPAKAGTEPVTISEFSRLISTKEGVLKLLKIKDKLPEPQKMVLNSIAEDMGLQ